MQALLLQKYPCLHIPVNFACWKNPWFVRDFFLFEFFIHFPKAYIKVEKTVCFLFCKWPLLLQIPLDLGSLPMKHPVFPAKKSFPQSLCFRLFPSLWYQQEVFSKMDTFPHLPALYWVFPCWFGRQHHPDTSQCWCGKRDSNKKNIQHKTHVKAKLRKCWNKICSLGVKTKMVTDSNC